MEREVEVSRNGLRRLRFGIGLIPDPGHFPAHMVGQ
jgi:hypothetical protein